MSASAQLHEATKWAHEIADIIRSFANWAAHDCIYDPEQFISPTSVLMMMEESLVPTSAQARIGLCLNGTSFVIGIWAGTLNVRRAATTDVDVVITGTAKQMMRQIARRSLDGTMQVDGDLRLAKRFLTLFPGLS